MNKAERAAPRIEMADVLTTIGLTIRRLRIEKGMTLRNLAERTRLSASMISLLERGRASPSIGTMVVLAHTFGVDMAALLGPDVVRNNHDIVSRAKSQRRIRTGGGVTRRIVKIDDKRALEISINEFDPKAVNSETPVTHPGFEYAFLLQGQLQITVNDTRHTLTAGDAISYPSTVPHRIVNTGKTRARALWINLRKG